MAYYQFQASKITVKHHSKRNNVPLNIFKINAQERYDGNATKNKSECTYPSFGKVSVLGHQYSSTPLLPRGITLYQRVYSSRTLKDLWGFDIDLLT